jgi:hypothetical protein
MDHHITHGPTDIRHRCFWCGAATELDIENATQIGWGFQPQRGIAACPNHSITAHDVNLALMAHCYGKTVDELHRGPALPINPDVLDELHRLRGDAAAGQAACSGDHQEDRAERDTDQELISHWQAEFWSGTTLTDSDLERLSLAIPHSSIPDAINTIVNSWDD